MGPIEAFHANASTFYNLRTRHRTNLWPRYLIMIAVSLFIPTVGIYFVKDALSALVSVLGVLLGFGYSVQFYLAGTALPKISSGDYIEDVGDKRILERAASEVYDNVAYLNFVILFSLIPMISLMIPGPASIYSPLHLDYLLPLGGNILSCAFVLEVVSTFYRVLKRSSFFFSERRRLAGDSDTGTPTG